MTQQDIQRKVSGILSADEVVAAFQAQYNLFEKFLSMARSPEEPEVIKAMLRETIGISTDLTGAELGSLILIDSDGLVVDSILSRGEISPGLSSRLIKSVLREGLAGWVIHHRKIGLVNDTEQDDRWLILSDQPYVARSALALARRLVPRLQALHQLASRERAYRARQQLRPEEVLGLGARVGGRVVHWIACPWAEVSPV